jgi:transcriptional regulator with XRE-family HTH domain
MGRGRRGQPGRLSAKLLAIRERLGLTQQALAGLLRAYAPDEFVDASYVSQYEKGRREPSLLILLAYSQLTGLSVNVLIDDRMELPSRISSMQKNT